MSKNIVICMDGTWNDKEDANTRTNVALLHDMCLDDGASQITHYLEGVGTDGWYDKKLGGVHGVGLSENVREACARLASDYSSGDKVFLFGFSRGAFTARSLAGFVFRCGLGADDSDIRAMFDAYRDKDDDAMNHWKSVNRTCPIEMIGVWDTVGALGIPVSFLRDAGEKVFSFHDTKLSPEVSFACHALAIDERRASFAPTLWHEEPGDQTRVQQVWFAGVHADVGGGYAERHHSDVALRWMVDAAKSRGLHLGSDPSYDYNVDLEQNIHESAFQVFGLELGVEHRQASVLAAGTPDVHASVQEKMRLRRDYEPLALVKQIVDRDSLAPYRVV